ncbi:MAG: hypothetical protein ABI723_18695 [Bacteroidia bacterium]
MKSLKHILCIVILSALTANAIAQSTAISDVVHAPVTSAMLDVFSTSKGFLVPRMLQAQKTAVATPATGLLIYQTDGAAGFYYYDGTAWIPFTTSSTGWLLDGNSVPSMKTLGTITNYDLPIITNNSERMRVTKTGLVGIGSIAFDPINPERLLVDYGNTTSNTLATFRGNTAGYLQVNVQNTNSGTNSSADYVATADNGTDTTNYIDMGINSSTYAPGVDNFGGPNDGYLYTYARNLLIGTIASTNSDIIFLVNGGQLAVNQAMRIDATTKNIIIGRKDGTTGPLGNTVRGPNGAGTNISGGSLTFVAGNATGTGVGGALNISGGSTVSGTGGAVNVNAGTNNATNIGTGANTQNVTVGNSTNNIILPKWTTVGGVYYNSTAGGQLGDASLMVWDNTNTRLGIGTATPTATLNVVGNDINTGYMAVGQTALPPNKFRMIVRNEINNNGLVVNSSGNLGDIIFRLVDQDSTFNILDVEAQNGNFIFGNTYAATMTARGIVYGLDNQNLASPGQADINTQTGVYRQAGVAITPYNIGGGIKNNNYTTSVSTSTVSTTYVLMTGMTSTPAAGTYMVTFSASARGTNTDQQMQVSLYSAGTLITHTQRSYGYNTNVGNLTKRFNISTQALITVNGAQAIEARYKTNVGTFNVDERSMIVIKITD